MSEDGTLTPVTEVKVGDLIDFYPILENVTSDDGDDLEVLRLTSEVETFVVETIEVEGEAVVLHTSHTSWAFPKTDQVLVTGNVED